MRDMPTVTITATSEKEAQKYMEAVQWAGGQVLLCTLRGGDGLVAALEQSGGLMLIGGPDIHPSMYGQVPQAQAGLELSEKRDDLDKRALAYALEHDMAVFAICRGMQVLNVAFGGGLIPDLPGHRMERKDGAWIPAHHSIYISPGSKLAAVIGSGGFSKVNSLHHQGLREAQKSPRLLASAYSLEDGIIEGLESPEHDWVIGLQCHPERMKEVPLSFRYLFQGFVERAARYRS